MRNWLIAMAVSGTLTGLLHTASAQEIKRTGSGFAKSECFASWGSCGGLGPETCSGPDCNVSVSGNGTIFPGFDGKASLNMSAMSIQVSGEASFTPPSPCSESTFTGGPVYIANGSQSIYADVPNETPIRITITSSLSGKDGGGATWSDAKSGAGGASGTTVFDTKAGPGKITDSGVDYYLIDTIGAQGNAGARRKCDEPNNQSFSGSLSMSFCVAAGKMKAASSTSLTAIINTPVSLKVQVKNGCTGAPLEGQSISFSGVDSEGGQNFSLESSAQTDANGFATVSFTPKGAPGLYSVVAVCTGCGANRTATFNINAVTLAERRHTLPVPVGSCVAWLEPPPPHEICINESLPLHCQCHPVSAQRTINWSTPSPGQITQDSKVPENATFTSPQEGDFSVNLKYFPNTQGAPSCNTLTTVKVRDVQVVGWTVTLPALASGGNEVSAFAGDTFFLHVQLNGPRADTTAFGYISVQAVGGQAIITPIVKKGSIWTYEVRLPNSENFEIEVKGCSNSVNILSVLVAPELP